MDSPHDEFFSQVVVISSSQVPELEALVVQLLPLQHSYTAPLTLLMHVHKISVFTSVLVSSGCPNTTAHTGWLNQWKSTFSQFWRLEVQDQETLLPGLQMADFSVSSHGLSSVDAQKGRGWGRGWGTGRVSLLSLSLVRIPVLLNSDPTLVMSFNLNEIPKDSVSKYSHIRG